VERSLCGCSFLEMFFDSGIIGLGPTQGDEKWPVQQLLSLEAPPSPLSSRPKRTRISYFALLATTTCAALRKESRTQLIKATGLDRKSGGAQWRDLRFSGPFLGNVFRQRSHGLWARPR
jgi:hypothetical protein